VPAEVITTLAVIEQTDDADFSSNKEDAFNEVLSQYGLKKGEAYRYSVSRASASAHAVHEPARQWHLRARGAALPEADRPELRARRDGPAERDEGGDLPVRHRAAQMRADIRAAYRDNMKVLGIFPGRRLQRRAAQRREALQRDPADEGVKLEELRPPGDEPEDRRIACPCLWKAAGTNVLPVSIPRYNNENRWYIEKYQSILTVFDGQDEESLR
jgi:hypothetical protein